MIIKSAVTLVKIQYPDAWFHVMNRGRGRRTVFHDDGDRALFLRKLGESCGRSGIVAVAYCLLGNHYHLVVRRNDGDLSAAMRRLGSQYTAHNNRRHDTDGPLFRGRYTSVPITTDHQLVATVAYVHANVFDIGPHADPRSLAWSSHPIYLGRAEPPPWFDTSLVLSVASAEALDRRVMRRRAA